MSKRLVALQKEETVVAGQEAFKMSTDLPDGKKLVVFVLTSEDLTPTDLKRIKGGQQMSLGDGVKVVMFGKGADEEIDLFVEEA